MKWNDKYPNAKIDQEIDSRLKSGVIGKCFMCQKRTSWIGLCFEAHLCSEECEVAAFEDMDRRMRKDSESPIVPF